MNESSLLDRSRGLDAELTLKHVRARIGLDIAEFLQGTELEECNRIDRRRRQLERLDERK